MQPWSVVLGIVILLGTAAVLGIVARRIGQGPILGAIAAGILLGPGMLGVLRGDAVIDLAGELGVALLMFTVGLEFSWEELRRLGRRAALAGALQVTVTLAAAAVLLREGGAGWPAAVAAGAMFALSSTALVVSVVRDRREDDTTHARLATAVLLLQDMAVVPLVLLVAALGEGASAARTVVSMLASLLATAALFALLYFLSRRALPRLMGATAASGSRDLPILLSVATCLGAAWIAHRLHVSPGIGAFVAGLLLASSPFATRVRADIGALRVLFVTAFFASVGVRADLPWIATHWVVVTGATVGLIAGKTIVVALIGAALGFRPRTAVAAGLCLAQVGEFAFVLAGVAGVPAMLGESRLQLLVATAVLSLIATPWLVAWSPRAGEGAEWLLRRAGLLKQAPGEEPSSRMRRKGHVVVLGLGPAGRGAALRLQARGFDVLAVELNPRAVAQAQREGVTSAVGDAASEDVLEHADVADAAAIVVAIPDLRVATEVLGVARSLAPLVPIVARARYHAHALHLLAAGAALVADEEWETGGKLGDSVAALLGVHAEGEDPPSGVA